MIVPLEIIKYTNCVQLEFVLELHFMYMYCKNRHIHDMIF